MKSRLLGAVCAFCLFAYQPASADRLVGESRLSSNPSFAPVAFSSDLLVNQNVLPKPPSSSPVVQAPEALLIVGGSLLCLVVIARRKNA
jgi:hypothetical protein